MGALVVRCAFLLITPSFTASRGYKVLGNLFWGSGYCPPYIPLPPPPSPRPPPEATRCSETCSEAAGTGRRGRRQCCTLALTTAPSPTRATSMSLVGVPVFFVLRGVIWVKGDVPRDCQACAISYGLGAPKLGSVMTCGVFQPAPHIADIILLCLAEPTLPPLLDWSSQEVRATTPPTCPRPSCSTT